MRLSKLLLVATIITSTAWSPAWSPARSSPIARRSSRPHLLLEETVTGLDESSADELCYLPIFDDDDVDDPATAAAAERFRLVLTAFPLLTPPLAFISYDSIVPVFHEIISFTKTWYTSLSPSPPASASPFADIAASVAGGQAEIALITPVINGIVQPAVSIVFGTLIASTLTTLRNRQVSIRACLNKEACDLRMLDATLGSIFGAVEDRALRLQYVTLLRQYVTRLIVESEQATMASQGASGVSVTSESELDGLIRSMYRTTKSKELCNDARFYDPLRFQLPGLVQSLNHMRSQRLAELQTTYPKVHWLILGLLGASIVIDFFIESDQAALQFFDSVRLRLLFTILVGVGSAVASLLVDLNDPFRGNFRITPSADQFKLIRLTLTEEACDCCSAMASATARKGGPLARIDATLRVTINGVLHGADAYSTLKLLLVLLGISRVLRDLRRASRCEGLYAWLMSIITPWLKRLPFVQRQLKKETDKLRADIQPSLIKDVTQPKTKLPATGQPTGTVLQLMHERRELDTKYWHDGHVTGAIYHGKREYMDFVGTVYGLFAFTNPLHASIHPATRQMESEVISMVLRMYSGPSGSCGAFTTGGTESILMAMKAYRDKGRDTKGITQPNIVVCVTAHAAFDKAAQYFNIECRKARTVGPQEIDVSHVRSLIDSNTVAIVGSACQYAHGTIDDIPAMSDLALAHDIGLHVDCCLGGFLLPFMRQAGFEVPHEYDFRVPGVTTISCDPHKYGFAPKGSSVLMFRTPELRHHMYTFVTEWTGGIYATPSILGSRPGGVVAATWAAMIHHGEAGYVETTKQIVGAARKIGAAIEAIDGLELMGRPDVCVVAWHGAPGSGINCYSLCDALKEVRGWDLATLQRPPSVHLALTLPTSENADQFIDDLKQAVAKVKADPQKYSGGTAGLYGTASKMPASFVEESAKVFLDVMTMAAEEESASAAA